jgi:uncharacterized membrane protein YfcA
MSIETLVLLLLIGFAIGAISGMIGIGGGVLVIPVLMIGFGFSQAKANGTSLAMLLPPIGIFAVLAYAKGGNIDWRYAVLLSCGFAVGAFVGAKAVNLGWIHPTALRVLFALLLLYIAGRTLFRPGGQARAALETSLLIVGYVLTYAVMRIIGAKWHRRPRDWASVYRDKQRVPEQIDYEI